MAKKKSKQPFYSYRYVDDSGQPIHDCPECGEDLTQPGSITLVLSVDGRILETDSQLEDGWLEDTNDGAVASGFHSTTLCGDCGQQLQDMDGVSEQTYENDELTFSS